MKKGFCVLILVLLSPSVFAVDFDLYSITLSGKNLARHAISPWEACRDSVGHWSNAGLSVQVIAARFRGDLQTCALDLDDGTSVAASVVVTGFSCTDPARWDGVRRLCTSEVVNREQFHALGLAAFLWMCLIGGMYVGLKVVE